MYDFAMSKINDLLADLEDAVITSIEFVTAKVKIQDELYRIVDSLPEGDPSHAPAKKMLTQWRLLGGASVNHKSGNLASYVTAINDLKAFLTKLDA